MAGTRVNPTRMELTKQKKKLFLHNPFYLETKIQN